MDKMRFETPDVTAQNIDKIAEMFPNCITEMLDEEHSTPEKKVYKKAINFDLLKQMLSPDVIDSSEAYEFTWVGKKAAIVEANKPIRKTLRPCPEESKDWDTTENLYIEGDNLEVLKLLQENYMGKVKMIYIDPPYNTGHDLIYRDDFKQSVGEYEEQFGIIDGDNNHLFKNTDSNGRFHSDWCRMIYPRLLLARNIMADDGVIFISIDENEQSNLKEICDEIFGISNFQAMISYVRKTSGKQDSTNFMKSTEFILVYSKNNSWDCAPIIASDKVIERYNKTDENGTPYRETDLRKTGNADRREDRPLMWYPFYYNEKSGDLQVRKIEDINLVNSGYVAIYPIKPDGSEGRWRWGYQTACDNQEYLVARVMPKYKSERKYTVYEVDYIDKKGDVRTVKEHTFWNRKEFNSDNAIGEFKSLGFSNQLFPFPKSKDLIKHMIYLANLDVDDIVLDFFSGSATTAHAVMQLNAEDGGHRKFIMVQLPEPCDEKSEAYKAGYMNICEIGKERIRRAGEKIKLEMSMAKIGIDKNQLVIRAPGMEDKYALTAREAADEEVIKNLDVGFRVFKLDESNMTDVYYSAGEYTQDLLSQLESNVKPDRTDLDLFFGCILEWGLPLSMPHKSEKIDGCTVHTYNDGDLIACFDGDIPESVIKEIAGRRPLRAVFRDSGFADSPAKINVGEIFKMLAPDTRVKVI